MDRKDWLRVCGADEIAEGYGRQVILGEETVAVFKCEGRFYGLHGICPHRGGPLGMGDVEAMAVVCPLHGWAFDLEDGTMRGNPIVTVPTYDVIVEEDAVYLKKEPRETMA